MGRGIALALANKGAAVAVVGRTLGKCERSLAEIKARGGRGVVLCCDVSRRDEVEAVVAATVQALGAPHILVNNAHNSRPLPPIVDVSDNDMHIAMKGTTGTLLFMQAGYPPLAKAARNGRVINLGSVPGHPLTRVSPPMPWPRNPSAPCRVWPRA